MSEENLKAITDAGGTVCFSFQGRGHFGAVTGNDGNGNFYVADSDPNSFKGRAVPYDTTFSGGSGVGRISGKKVWVIIPNSALTVNGDQVTINGVDASTLPGIRAFETAGTAYDVTRNADGSMTVSGLAENYSYEV